MRPETANQRALLEGTIRGLETEIARVNHEIREIQKKVDATPKREQELITLTRDYENIKTSYNSLLNRKLEADISVNMEKKQKGEQFQIIDAARLPEKPVSPDPKKTVPDHRSPRRSAWGAAWFSCWTFWTAPSGGLTSWRRTSACRSLPQSRAFFRARTGHATASTVMPRPFPW